MAKQINSESQQKTTRVADLIYLIGVEFGVFSKIVSSRLAVLTFCLFLTSHIYAHEEESVSATDSSSVSNKVTQAINICPGAIAFGMLSVNYEYLFGQTHGLVARFDYDKISESYSDDTIESNGFGFTLNYRWHWSEAMESWFLGSFLRYRFYNGSGTSDLTKFDFTMPEFTVGLNIGKRWVWSSGINMTIAVGYGISWSSTETEPTSASITSTIKTFEDEYEFLGPLLGEFSVGYAF